MSRPRATVRVACDRCGSAMALDPLDARLPDGPFVCTACGWAGDETASAQERRLGLARWLRVVRWLGLASRRGRA